MERDASQPFCLVLASINSHAPWTGDASVFDRKKLQLPPQFVDTEVTRILWQNGLFTPNWLVCYVYRPYQRKAYCGRAGLRDYLPRQIYQYHCDHDTDQYNKHLFHRGGFSRERVIAYWQTFVVHHSPGITAWQSPFRREESGAPASLWLHTFSGLPVRNQRLACAELQSPRLINAGFVFVVNQNRTSGRQRDFSYLRGVV